MAEIDAWGRRSDAAAARHVSTPVTGHWYERIVGAPAIGLGMILVIAAALDVFHLGAKSLWLDEAGSIANAQLDWPTLFRVLFRSEANMSLYYGLLHVWLRLGRGEFTVRLLSVVAALAAVVAVYFLGKRLFSPRVGLVGGLLLAVNAFTVTYAQTARGYSLLILLVLLGSLAFVQAVEQSSGKRWTVYVVIGVSSVYAHFFAFLVLLAHAAALPLFDRRRVAWRCVLASAAVMSVCLLPLALFALANYSGVVSTFRAYATLTRYNITEVFYGLSGAGVTRAKPLLAAYGLACALAVWTAVRGKERTHTGFLVIWFGLPIAFTLAVSTVMPFLVSYYLIVSLPPLVLLAAAGVSTLRRRAFALALVVIVGLALYEDGRYYAAPGPEGWRAAVRYTLARARPGDALFFYPAYLQKPYDYYRSQTAPPIAFPQHWSWARTAGYGEPMEGQPEALAVVKTLPRTYSRIWVFSRYGSVGLRLRAALAESYPSAQTRRFQAVGVTLYSRGP